MSNTYQIGWVCPLCGRALSPLTFECPCYQSERKSNTASTAVLIKSRVVNPQVLEEKPLTGTKEVLTDG